MYRISKVVTHYKNGFIVKAQATFDCGSQGYKDIRTVEMTNKPCPGYGWLPPGLKSLSDDLVYKLCATGRQIK